MNLNLKKKIFILVALPSISLAVLIFIFIGQNFSDYQDAERSVVFVKYSDTTSRLIHEIQKERGKSALFLGGKIERQELDEQRALTIKASKQYTENIPADETASKLKTFQAEVFKTMTAAREIVDSKGPTPEATGAFGKSIQQLILSQIYVAHTVRAFGNEKKLLSVTLLDSAKEKAGQLRANISAVLSADKPLTNQQIKTISSLLAGLNENLDSPTLIITDKTRSELDDFKSSSSWTKAQETIALVLNHSAEGNYGQNPTEFFKNITVSIDNLGNIIFTEQDYISDLILQKKEEIKNQLILVIALNILWLAFGFWMSVYFIRSITLPIQGLMEKLNASSRDVNDSSEKVSFSSEQLSQNSTQQAAALQETVATLEEMTQMIGKTADNARISQNVSQESSRSVEHGQVIVSELNESIGEISDANERIKQRILKSNSELEEISKIIAEIGNKTKVINDIVFQTKLLSFNASVEAARAGEQGKGFSVVAEEIGNLASMSGNAANEISDVLDKSLAMVNKTIENTKKEAIAIIEQSVQKVEKGSKAAVRCGQSLNEIVEKVQQVNKLVVEIATASNEQSQGMAQISLAMNELDSATHSNSSSSVETAKAGQLLKDQAKELDHAVQELAVVVYGDSASQAKTFSKVVKVTTMKPKTASSF